MIGSRQIDGFDALTIADPAGELEAAFVPAAGMICCSLRHRGEEILGQRNGLAAYVERKSTMGIPLLYPWANRLGADRFSLGGETIDLGAASDRIKRDENGLPIHGLLSAASEWQVVSHEVAPGGGTLSALFEWGADEELMGLFPFPHRIRYSAAVADSGLRIELEIAPERETRVPIAFGFHPYLAPPLTPRAEWVLTAPLSAQIPLDRRGLPSGPGRSAPELDGPLGSRALDDLFESPPAGTPIAIAGHERTLEMRADAAYRYTQLYAPDGSELIAIEPMTAATDGLRAGNVGWTDAGGSFSAAFSLGVTSTAG